MKRYIGTKVINARPMNRADYNTHRSWPLAADENGADEGYLVECLDGGAPNHPGHAGYISWSPKAQFENAYTATEGMTFGQAIYALRIGFRVAREGWNGKSMWLHLVKDWNGDVGGLPLGCELLPWIGMKTADDKFVPWLASQTDMLALDWGVV